MKKLIIGLMLVLISWFFVECLIERPGDTTINIGGFQYEFQKAENDDALVCEVMSPEHQNWFLRMPAFWKTAKDHGIQVPFNAKKEDLQDTLLRMIS